MLAFLVFGNIWQILLYLSRGNFAYESNSNQAGLVQYTSLVKRVSYAMRVDEFFGLGGVRNGPAFLLALHILFMLYIFSMLDICLELSKFEALKMLDLQTKSAMKLVCGRVSIQATSQAFSAIHSILGTNGRYFKSLLGINPYPSGYLPIQMYPLPYLQSSINMLQVKLS